MAVEQKENWEGWGWPENSRKAHYFVDGRSLCKRWLFLGLVEQGNDNSPDNCPTCMKKLAKSKEVSHGKKR